MKKILIIPDTHVPYHDKRALDLMLKVGKDFKPDTVAILGDFADFYSVSSHSKDPNRKRNLEFEIEAVNKELDKIGKLGADVNIFIAGNHEDRLERFLMDKAPELFNMVQVKQLFRLRERGWRYVPYKDNARIGKLYLTHDTGTAGATANVRALNDFQYNVAIGHTHRMGYNIIGNARGEPHVGAMLGWLGDVKQVDYMHRIKAARDWCLGFGVGYMEPSGVVHLQPVPIVNYKCVVGGKLFCG